VIEMNDLQLLKCVNSVSLIVFNLNIFQILCYDFIKYVLYCVLKFSCAPVGKILSDRLFICRR